MPINLKWQLVEAVRKLFQVLHVQCLAVAIVREHHVHLRARGEGEEGGEEGRREEGRGEGGEEGRGEGGEEGRRQGGVVRRRNDSFC